jgi:hypothetical protein
MAKPNGNREHWAFFYKENGPNGKPLEGISYFCVTKSSSGIVSLPRAIELARKYEKNGVNIVLDKNSGGEDLPLSANERAALTAADSKMERETLRTVEHPGRQYLHDLIARIPPQKATLESD